MIRIATIVTCFNRKQKTLSCLRHFYEAINYYNQSNLGWRDAVSLAGEY